MIIGYNIHSKLIQWFTENGWIPKESLAQPVKLYNSGTLIQGQVVHFYKYTQRTVNTYTVDFCNSC